MSMQWKRVTGTNASTYPVEIWKPAAGKLVRIHYVYLSVANKDGTAASRVLLKFRIKDSTMQKILGINRIELGTNFFSQDFTRGIETDPSASPTADKVIDFDKAGATNSTNFSWFCAVLGEEV